MYRAKTLPDLASSLKMSSECLANDETVKGDEMNGRNHLETTATAAIRHNHGRHASHVAVVVRLLLVHISSAILLRLGSLTRSPQNGRGVSEWHRHRLRPMRQRSASGEPRTRWRSVSRDLCLSSLRSVVDNVVVTFTLGKLDAGMVRDSSLDLLTPRLFSSVPTPISSSSRRFCYRRLHPTHHHWDRDPF